MRQPIPADETDVENRHAEPESRITDLQAQRELDRAEIAYLQDQHLRDGLEIEQLTTALTTARSIGAAVGIIMATAKVIENDAFELLTRISQRQNRKLRDLADDIVRTGHIATR